MKIKTLQIDVVANNIVATAYSFGSNHYVGLPHMTPYMFRFTNLGSTKGDAVLSVDGEYMGTYRVPAGGQVDVRCRGRDNDREFVFFKEESKETDVVANKLVGNANNGLVKVEWKPERMQHNRRNSFITYSGTWPTNTLNCSSNTSLNQSNGDEILNELSAPLNQNDEEDTKTRGLQSGLTMYGKSSGQKWYEVPDITDVDTENSGTAVFRLAYDPKFGTLQHMYTPVQTAEPPRIETLTT